MAPSSAPVSSRQLVEALRDPQSYPHRISDEVAVHETHISWVFLAGDFAYKVKKAIKTDYLDYSSLKKREHYCHEELRLNRRYAPSLYLETVPITFDGDKLQISGDGDVVEHAVKMHRFPENALLSEQVDHDDVDADAIGQLAGAVADFHNKASPAPAESQFGEPKAVIDWAIGNFDALEEASIPDTREVLVQLREWTQAFCDQQANLLHQRVVNGFIRECHGDLHTANIVHWKHRWIPFDGIEFNRELRWIDLLNDAAFVSMDLACRDHKELSHLFINEYLSRTGDYASLTLLRFYQVYRAMVRAKIATARSALDGLSEQQRTAELDDCRKHLELALNYTRLAEPVLWITHGFSGSGKSLGSREIVQRQGAIQLRSDVERKRLYGLEPTKRAKGRQAQEIYAPTATSATYQRLRQLAGQILRAGYPVIVDATFLKAEQRALLAECAACEQVPFRILDFRCDEPTLRQRVRDRMEKGDDASDAGIEVLEQQLRNDEPLTKNEEQYTTAAPASDMLSETV